LTHHNHPSPHSYYHSFPTRRSSDLRLLLARSRRRTTTSPRWSGHWRPAITRRSCAALITPPGSRWWRCTISISRLARTVPPFTRSEEHTSELQSLRHLVCRLLLEKK